MQIDHVVPRSIKQHNTHCECLTKCRTVWTCSRSQFLSKICASIVFIYSCPRQFNYGDKNWSKRHIPENRYFGPDLDHECLSKRHCRYVLYVRAQINCSFIVVGTHPIRGVLIYKGLFRHNLDNEYPSNKLISNIFYVFCWKNCKAIMANDQDQIALIWRTWSG